MTWCVYDDEGTQGLQTSHAASEKPLLWAIGAVWFQIERLRKCWNQSGEVFYTGIVEMEMLISHYDGKQERWGFKWSPWFL